MSDTFLNDYERMALQFQSVFRGNVNKPLSAELLRLRKRLLLEEVEELSVEIDRAVASLEVGEEVDELTLTNMLKEAADIQYVLSGLSVTFGWPIAEAVARVHDSNMSKLGPDGKPIFREDGKVLKGPNYKLPDLSDLVSQVRGGSGEATTRDQVPEDQALKNQDVAR